jgi:hypothetical protein
VFPELTTLQILTGKTASTGKAWQAVRQLLGPGPLSAQGVAWPDGASAAGANAAAVLDGQDR